MSNLTGLEQRLAALLEGASERRAQERRANEAEMLRIAPLRARFEGAASFWISDLVLPRLQALDRSLRSVGQVEHIPGMFTASLKVRWTRDTGVAASLSMSIAPGADFERATVSVQPMLVPMFAGHPLASTRDFEIETQDLQALEEFLDEGIVTFAGAYLRAGDSTSPYQRESFSTDPVCGMTVHHAAAAVVHEHNGRQYYFCAVSCAERFIRDPDRYTSNPAARIGGMP